MESVTTLVVGMVNLKIAVALPPFSLGEDWGGGGGRGTRHKVVYNY